MQGRRILPYNAIAQNVGYLLDSVLASAMLSNSEFIVMLNLAASDRLGEEKRYDGEHNFDSGDQVHGGGFKERKEKDLENIQKGCICLREILRSQQAAV